MKKVAAENVCFIITTEEDIWRNYQSLGKVDFIVLIKLCILCLGYQLELKRKRIKVWQFDLRAQAVKITSMNSEEGI